MAGETHYLHGAEDVRRAASTMSAAAETMRSAAAYIDEALQRAARQREEQLAQLTALVERLERLPDKFAQALHRVL